MPVPEYLVYFVSPTSTSARVTAETPEHAVEIATNEVHAPLCHQCARSRDDADFEATSVEDVESGQVLNLDEFDAANARVAELEAECARLGAATEKADAARDEIAKKLRDHRSSSTREFDTGRYKNPVRQGYDRGLTEALGLLGLDAAEVVDRG